MSISLPPGVWTRRRRSTTIPIVYVAGKRNDTRSDVVPLATIARWIGTAPMQEFAPIAERIASLLKARGETLAVAESSTGGLISAALVAVPGASAYFLGSAVVYTRLSRRVLLGIPDAALADIRPATEAYARLMARTDPVGAARHVREALAIDGSWMIVEPFAHDRVEDNLNPVGRIYYAASTMICTPASLSQEVALGLGAQAGETRLRGGCHRRRPDAVPPRHRDSVQSDL
jgi:nicotinamide mononucleotide (NMN) deamidase PncC